MQRADPQNETVPMQAGLSLFCILAVKFGSGWVCERNVGDLWKFAANVWELQYLREWK